MVFPSKQSTIDLSSSSSTEEDDDALEPKEASEAQSCDDQFFPNVKIC